MKKNPFNQLASCNAGGLGAGRRIAKWIESHPNQTKIPNDLPFCYVQPAPNNSGSNYYLTCIANQTIPRSVAWSPDNAIPFSVLYQHRYPVSTAPPIPPSVPTGSIFFDCTDQNSYLTLSPSITNIGTQDFTIECWINLTPNSDDGQEGAILGGANNTSNNLLIKIFTSNQSTSPNGNGIYVYQTNSTYSSYNYAFNSNTWYYICFVRKSRFVNLFINGVSQTTGTDKINTNYTNIDVIGSWNTTNSSNLNIFPGYISSLRVVIGSALYDPSSDSISIPTEPLSFVPNTKLLLPTYANNPFFVLPTTQSIINSIVTGTNNSPFNVNTTGSLGFDGAQTYLSIVTPISISVFTIEIWVQYLGFPGTLTGLFGSLSTKNEGLIILLSDSITITSCNGSGGFNEQIEFDGLTISDQNWHYLVIVFDGSNTTLFFDGNNKGTQSDTNTYSSIELIGGYFIDDPSTNYFSGNIASLRISNISTLYNVSQLTIPVPTQPFNVLDSTNFLMQTYLQNSFAVLPYSNNNQVIQNTVSYSTSSPFT